MTSHQYKILITFYKTNFDDVKIDQPSTKQFNDKQRLFMNKNLFLYFYIYFTILYFINRIND